MDRQFFTVAVARVTEAMLLKRQRFGANEGSAPTLVARLVYENAQPQTHVSQHIG